MTLDKASKIVKIWGVYLEYVGGKLTLIFSACIPESFLPFPIETLEEALNTVAKHHHNMGNKDEVKELHKSIGWLTAYKDDEEAVLQAAKLFNDLGWRKAILPVFKKFQKDWIKTQGDFQ
jgi:hypothetical protein